MASERKKKEEELSAEFVALVEKFLNRGWSMNELRSSVNVNEKRFNKRTYRNTIIFVLISIFFIPIISSILLKKFYATRCLIKNNYFIWEFTRPISNCDYCRRVRSPLIMNNLTKDQFQSYAYLSIPIIAKGSANHWRASRVFNLEYFRNLYEGIDGSFDDEECQFLHFQSNFATLKEVFYMSKAREMNSPGEESWYVGWKNCHRQVLLEMNKFYENPNFLPDEAEVPSTNYIFMGYGQGAVMHLDYIPRLMWQGQIIGSKTWYVAPTPECEHVCDSFNFSVETGDIILLDTRIWYHGTQVENDTFSLTITSEYG